MILHEEKGPNVKKMLSRDRNRTRKKAEVGAWLKLLAKDGSEDKD